MPVGLLLTRTFRRLILEDVRLSANRDLLDRAGYKPVERSEVTEVTDISNMSTEEIQAELDSYYASAGKKLVNA